MAKNFLLDMRNSFPSQLIRRYFRHDVNRESAALTYYLIFSLFPLSIVISTLLGALELDVASITETLAHFAPADVVAFIDSYLRYASENANTTLLLFGLLFSVYFPMRAVDTLMRAVRRAYHVRRPAQAVGYFLRKLIYTVLLIVTIMAALVLVVVGRHVLTLIGRFIPLPELFIFLWPRLRFVVLALIMFFVLAALYVFSLEERPKLNHILPGVWLSLAVWLAASVAFSFYVSHFANYSLLYGSIGAVIVLLLWLYMTSILMIMGAEFNSLLTSRREKRARGKKQK